MIDINVPNVFTIFLISAIVIALAKFGAHYAGRDDLAALI